MSATKHTPGPWVVESDTDIVSDSGDFVASCHEPKSGVGTAREYANARLIAFAPAMFEALQTIANSQEHDLVGGRITVVCDFETLRLVAEEVVRNIEEAQS